jgi:cation:H+ antiporter
MLNFLLTSWIAHYTILTLLNKQCKKHTGQLMMTLFLPLGALILGVLGLVWGADKFVSGSSSIARSIGVSSLVIGLTIVSVGTSAPEIIVSINAALSGSAELAVGNALGSNLANMGLVLGVTLLIASIPVKKDLLQEEGLILLIVTGLAGLCLYNNYLGRLESVFLIFLTAPLLIFAVKYYKSKAIKADISIDNAETIAKKQAFFSFIIGLSVLLGGAELTVWSAKSIAMSMGISELVIGLTIVAIGTSLPELAASVVSALRGHHDIAVGNIIGSNLFNILLVMGAAGAISPIELSAFVFSRDYIAMALMTIVVLALVVQALRNRAEDAQLSRKAGIILLSGYVLYYIVLWLSNKGA